MLTIYKYQLVPQPNTNEVEVLLPLRSQVMYATTQQEKIMVYAMVDNAETEVSLQKFLILGTGFQVPANDGIVMLLPIGVCKFHDDSLVMHVFHIIPQPLPPSDVWQDNS